MRIHTLDSDGTVRRDRPITVEVRDANGELYNDPPVTITAVRLERSRLNSIQREATEWVPNARGKGGKSQLDGIEAVDLCLIDAITAWDGVLSNDGEPVAVTPEAVRELPIHVKTQVIDAVATTEAAEQQAASFRQSADVVRVVGGSGA